ncbi:MAG: rhodanese-like domain-containing protein [Nitrospirota bacterium]|nr:rhodanese-like domain-containing protein [Nitrospirota bacterium]
MGVPDVISVVLGSLLLVVLFGPSIMCAIRGVKGMNAAELRKRRKGADRKNLLILDVRSDGEFKSGHIREAHHLPLDRLSAGLPLLDRMKQHEVVVVCASGKRSAVAAVRLKGAGFESVYNLKGGMFAWGGEDVVRGQ